MENIIIIALVAGALGFLGYRLYRSVSKKGCDKGCSNNCHH